MDVIFAQHWSAFAIIAVIVASIAIAIIKKTMMTYALIVANLVAFVFSLVFFSEIVLGFPYNPAYAGLGFKAIYLTIEGFPNIYTIFTSMFIHSGIPHIFGNMLVFFFMGIAFEQRIGWKRFLAVYFIAGVCGTLMHVLIQPEPTVPLVGASGAIFGILGAFAFTYPRDEVVMPIPIGIMIITKIKVMYAAIIFMAMETVLVVIGTNDSTAHFAHFGGLIGGVIIAVILLRSFKQQRDEQDGSQQTIYYDSFQPKKAQSIDYDALQKLVQTPDQQQMLDRIKQESVPQVREVWIEHFIEKTACPTCGKPLHHLNGKIWCEHCGFKTKY